MEENKKTVSDLLTSIGKEIYGDDFSLENEVVKEVYKKTYTALVKNKLNKNKGVCIIGGIGAGKTAMMKVYQRLLKDTPMRFKLVNGYDLKDLSELYTTEQIKDSYGGSYYGDLYIDDIGFASGVKRYGNDVNLIRDILIERYDLFISSGYKTHLSSNIVAFMKNDIKEMPTLQKLYGERVVDRIKEMCELIIFKGESKRK
jgi:DNA replication protein DnaC